MEEAAKAFEMSKNHLRIGEKGYNRGKELTAERKGLLGEAR